MPVLFKNTASPAPDPTGSATRSLRPLIPLLLLVVAILFRAGTASGVPGIERTNPHDYADKTLCSACHTAVPPALNRDQVTTCVKCHSGNVDNHPISQHPIGKVPRISLPAAFPLTGDGQMVCYTCHEPHSKTKNLKLLRVQYHIICATCHTGY